MARKESKSKEDLDLPVEEKSFKINKLIVKPFGNLPTEEILLAFNTHTEKRPLIFDVEPQAYNRDDAQQVEAFTQPLFSENPILNKLHIRQGMLGNCYFLATLAAILQQPNGAGLIAGCMRDLSEPYQKDGRWTTLGKALGLKSDQKILVRLFGFRAVAYALVDKSEFLGPHRAQSPLYVQILEKAYAGLFKEQDMRHLESGLPQYVIDAFLGGEAKPSVKKIGKASATELKEIFSSNALIVMSTKHEIGESKSKGVAGESIISGLAAAHAYTVVNAMSKVFTKKILAKEYKEEHAGVNLFNPWGYDEESNRDLICGMHWQLELIKNLGGGPSRLSLQASPSGTENADSWVPMKLIYEKMLEVCYAPYNPEKDYAQALSTNAMRSILSASAASLMLGEPSLADKSLEAVPKINRLLSSSSAVTLLKKGQSVDRPLITEKSLQLSS